MSSPSMHLRAPGWYPSPDGAERWWDGASWTERVRAGVDPQTTTAVGAPGRDEVEVRIARAKRDATWAPLGLSITSLLGIVAVPLFHVIAVAFITLSIAGVATGVKAIGLRVRGLRIPLAPPVIGIVIGSGSTLVLAALLVLHVVSRMR